MSLFCCLALYYVLTSTSIPANYCSTHLCLFTYIIIIMIIITFYAHNTLVQVDVGTWWSMDSLANNHMGCAKLSKKTPTCLLPWSLTPNELLHCSIAPPTITLDGLLSKPIFRKETSDSSQGENRRLKLFRKLTLLLRFTDNSYGLLCSLQVCKQVLPIHVRIIISLFLSRIKPSPDRYLIHHV